ncbi:DUF4222 domain-containing protein [Cedecea sp. FDAARGOS_727]|uniref:DUF4222 domain-containing protein n=1 Tax=Cedecea sp. FDAARGOS_727 TaxID=2545798 RepID=UPI00143E6971|nr:DUF4222 domain-containing protein [Cedecea sp. FDAARGOS_727]QIX97431.1 DUF4222 domain-containing protein [Cedecea sp. FDAARGOS_727]
MCDSQELTERFRRMLQRNAAVPRQQAEIVDGERYQDSYGRIVTVISASVQRVQYLRAGYESPCEMSLYMFLKKYTKVLP